MGSRLKGWNLLPQNSEICFFHNHQSEFREFFSQENALIFCNYVYSVIEALGHQHDPTEWHLFIDYSEVSLKAVHLHNGDRLPSVPLSHACNMKESCGNMQLLLDKIQYEKYIWNICGDLKVVAPCLATQSFVAFCVSVIAGTEKNHYIKNSGLNKNWLFQDRKM